MVGRFFAAALIVHLVAGLAMADPAAPKKPSAQFLEGFSALRADEARARADAWLKSVGKTDDVTKRALDAVWADEERSVLDRVADSLMIGSPQALELLTEARDPKTSAPTEIPTIIKDTKVHPFLRANLALAYAKALADRRIYEEALETLKAVKVEQVVDPGQYLFLKLVSEHALIMKKDAMETISRLLENVPDAPERYTVFAMMALLDMEQWKDKDLGWIERKMGNIERRLDLSRGGKRTQKMQREVVARLDELIKEKENPPDGPAGPKGPSDDGPPGNTNQPVKPMDTSRIANNTGPGLINGKKPAELLQQWGKLPEKERARALAELTRDMAPAYREAIEAYFKKIGATDEPRR